MKIYAHRGFSYKYPEATRAAYQGAIEVGADGFECDVRLTKDGVAVCFHDRNTKRIAGVRRRVASLTLEELRAITEVMTLEELLELAEKNKKEVLIETKHPVLSGHRVERKIIELRKQYRFTAMSFSLFAVLKLKRELDDVAFVVAHRWRLLYIPTKKVAIDVELLAKSKWARRRLRNHEILLWTVNDKKYIPKLREWKVSGVITDRPDLPFRLG
ncbi:MAG: hypothetical protein FGM63_01135 [Candidatus Nanopelagicaceae bacterium]|nr:hypothetical protein [Candidatus Nanopelagicaceae bacterium]